MMASSSRPSKKPKGESTTKPNWLELPRDLTVSILCRLGTVDIVTSARNVCSLWWNICKDPLMWRTIDMLSDVNLLTVDPSLLVKICCYVVDLSCGHLEEIDIGCLGTDDLLQYIADRASHLRCIKLSDFQWFTGHQISNKGLIEAVNKLPLLEELDISFSNLSKDSLEVIGRCCPLLKSLKFYRMILDGMILDEIMSNELVFSIAKTMPGLRHINISGIVITNVGLLAILDGCSLLESLDIRECLNLDLSGSVEKRCHDHIRDLHLPYNKVDGSFDDDGLWFIVYGSIFTYLILIKNF